MAMPTSAFGGGPAAAWRRADLAKIACLLLSVLALLATFFASPGLGARVYGLGDAGGAAGGGGGRKH